MIELVKNPKYDFMGVKHYAFALSAVLILLGIIGTVQIFRGRANLGIELSADYTRQIRKRLRGIRSGDALDGAPEPLVSAPTTAAGRKLDARIHGRHPRRPRTPTTGQKLLPGLD